MYRVIFYISVFFLISSALVAQESKGVSWVDSTTYDSYLKGDWNRVIATGREAVKRGVDFYYLRMRMGIAWFSKKNYHKAIPQFRAALKFSENDPVALEFLYYCYLYTGREGDRQALIRSLPPALRKKLAIKKVEGIRSFEMYFYGFGNPAYSGIDYDPSSLPGGNGTQTVTSYGGEGAFRFRQAVGKVVSLEYGYHFLAKNRLYFYRDNSTDMLYTGNPYKQHQLFGSILLQAARGFSVGFSANYLNLRTQVGTEYPWHGSYLITETGQNWTTRLSLRGDLSFFSLYGGLGSAGLNGYRQLQADAGIVFYPFGNLNFYAGTGVTWLMQGTSMQSPEKDGNIIYTPFLGCRIAKPLWVELTGSTGTMVNYQGDNGWIIYNEMNPINKSAGLNLIFEIFKSGITLNLFSSWSQATSYYYQTDQVSSETYPVNYHILSFKAGIKWTFY